MTTANQLLGNHAPQSAFPDQHVGPVTEHEYRALRVLHEAAPRPIARLSLQCGHFGNSVYIGMAYLQARGWIRVRGYTWSFTERGLRDAPDRATVDAVKLPPLPQPFIPPPCGPIADVTELRMATLMVVIGDHALHRGCEVKSILARELEMFSRLQEATLAHGADADAVIELSREIKLNGDSSRAVEMALTVCTNVPPQAFADVLETYDRVWMLTARDTESIHLH